MLNIKKSPVFSFDENNETFTYDVCGSKQPVNFTLQNLQSKLLKIEAYGIYARLQVSGNLSNYFDLVAQTTNAAPAIFVVDTKKSSFNYTGSYRVTDWIFENNNTSLLLKNENNELATYFGRKNFDNNWENRIIYKKDEILEITIFDVTVYDGNASNFPITVQNTKFDSFGEKEINISELTRGLVPELGGLKTIAVCNVIDYFGNAEQITTPPVLLVDARNLDVNYKDFTMFAPHVERGFLPSVGQKLYIDKQNNKILPFYLNFVTNSEVGDYEVMYNLHIAACSGDMCIDNSVENVIVTQGLNVLDLSLNKTITDFILLHEPKFLKIGITGYFFAAGDFLALDFNDVDFFCETNAKQKDSGNVSIACESKILNDREDFLFYFDNGMGGKSSMLCKDFSRIAKPEITEMRNLDVISNFVSRETETVKLRFFGLSIDDFDFLTGYNALNAKKRDGIFESQYIERLTATGELQRYIIVAADYEVENAQLYRDLELTLKRSVIQN